MQQNNNRPPSANVNRIERAGKQQSKR